MPNDRFDEFALQGKLADEASGALPFRVVQTCEKGQTDWKGEEGSAEPAPVLEVTAPTEVRHHH